MSRSSDRHLDLGFPPTLAGVERNNVVREFEDGIVQPEMHTRPERVNYHAGFVRPEYGH